MIKLQVRVQRLLRRLGFVCSTEIFTVHALYLCACVFDRGRVLGLSVLMTSSSGVLHCCVPKEVLAVVFCTTLIDVPHLTGAPKRSKVFLWRNQYVTCVVRLLRRGLVVLFCQRARFRTHQSSHSSARQKRLPFFRCRNLIDPTVRRRSCASIFVALPTWRDSEHHSLCSRPDRYLCELF